MSSTNFHYLLKYIIVGDSSVGKSNILLQFTQKKFKKDHELTIGVEFGARNVTSEDNKIFRVQVWDTAGQETFRSITRAYYKNSACAFLVYDVTKKETFEHISTWYEECLSNTPKTTLIALVGSVKLISKKNRREVTFSEAEKYAKKNNMIFFETSAKTGKNIEEIFITSINEINEKINKNLYDLSNESCGIKMGIGNNYYDKQFNISRTGKKNKNKKCC